LPATIGEATLLAGAVGAAPTVSRRGRITLMTRSVGGSVVACLSRKCRT
jgi:hypothetical protein